MTTHTTPCYIIYPNKAVILVWYNVFYYQKCIILYQVVILLWLPEDDSQPLKYVGDNIASLYMFCMDKLVLKYELYNCTFISRKPRVWNLPDTAETEREEKKVNSTCFE